MEVEEVKKLEEEIVIEEAPKTLQSLFSDLSLAIERELSALQKKKDDFEIEKKRWEETACKLEKTQIPSKIRLDIGGTVFATSLSILTAIPDTYFAGMFSGRWEVKREEDGSIFIDRDPFAFRYIINFMREYPNSTLDILLLSPAEIVALKRDADYYQIEPLRESLRFSESNLELNQYDILKTWLGTERSWRLLFRPSKDGLTSQAFHRLCDGKGETVVFIKTNNGCLFGGYTGASWHSDGSYIADPTAYIFTLKNLYKIPPTRFNCTNANQAIYGTASNGPIFGSGHDLNINFNGANCGGTCKFPHSYEDTTGKGNLLFSGANTFAAIELEVWGRV